MDYLVLATLYAKVFNQPIPLLISEISQEQGSASESQKLLIVGRWRGFNETPSYTIYYAYEFRPTGEYIARHRVYEGAQTVRDDLIAGTWNLEEKFIQLQGRITNANSATHQLILNYQLTLGDDGIIYYESGNLPSPYVLGRMGKI